MDSQKAGVGTTVDDVSSCATETWVASSIGRALALHARGRGIETLAIHGGVVAQMVERSLSMREVGGSMPSDSRSRLIASGGLAQW